MCNEAQRPLEVESLAILGRVGSKRCVRSSTATHSFKGCALPLPSGLTSAQHKAHGSCITNWEWRASLHNSRKGHSLWATSPCGCDCMYSALAGCPRVCPLKNDRFGLFTNFDGGGQKANSIKKNVIHLGHHVWFSN